MAHTTEFLGAYCVTDFCDKLDNLPNTEADAQGWLDAAETFEKPNFLLKNEQVVREDFAKATDKRAAGSLPAKKTGIESVIAAYVSTHGGRTAADDFIFELGNQDGKCVSMKSNEMELGNNGSLRYLFLSTCESVSKDTPGHPWVRVAKGLRAIFGYDGVIKDSPNYGKFFFEELKKKGATTTQAFLDASWRVNHNQIAVALWFGKDAESARRALDEESEFQSERVDGNFVAAKWQGVEKVPATFDLSRARSLPLTFQTPSPPITDTDHTDLLRHFIDDVDTLLQPVAQIFKDSYHTYSAGDGIQVVRNPNSGSLDITFPAFYAGYVSACQYEAQQAISMAQECVQKFAGAIPGVRSTIAELELGLIPTAVRRSYLATYEASSKPDPSCTHMTVVFRQTVNGVPTIGSGGVVEVTLDHAGTLCRARILTREVTASFQPGTPNTDWPEIVVEDAIRQAKTRACEEYGSDTKSCEVVSTEFGYYTADDGEAQSQCELGCRVLVKVSSGPCDGDGSYGRLYEKIYWAHELN